MVRFHIAISISPSHYTDWRQFSCVLGRSSLTNTQQSLNKCKSTTRFFFSWRPLQIRQNSFMNEIHSFRRLVFVLLRSDFATTTGWLEKLYRRKSGWENVLISNTPVKCGRRKISAIIAQNCKLYRRTIDFENLILGLLLFSVWN